MDKLIRLICDTLEHGEDVVMATVADSSGQTRLAGARMLFHRDGSTHGSIGGGFFEAEVQEAATGLFALGNPGIRIIRLSGENDASLQAPCGNGTVAVVEHIAAVQNNLDIFRELLEARQKGLKCCLVTTMSNGGGKEPPLTRTLSNCNEASLAAGGADSAFRYPELMEKLISVSVPLIEDVGKRVFFLNPWRIPETVYICGAGHVAQETAELAGKSGFRIIVMDDREKYANLARFPSAHSVVTLDSFDNCFQGMAVNDDSYIIIATRGHRYENTLVRQALKTHAGYIGLIGSLRKRNVLFAELSAEGFSIDDLLRVYCPTGVSILAETPEEIAVSIVAQLVLLRARKANARKEPPKLHPDASSGPRLQSESQGEGIRAIR
ncbi:MAG: XdhC family protein [Geobacteraceae bacterium]|nr:XdhC family protein [Geobacteraceae bacterium]